MEVYTKKHLLEALAKAGLPSSYKSLLEIERRGVIPRGGMLKSVNDDRFYTLEEINSIVEQVKKSREK